MSFYVYALCEPDTGAVRMAGLLARALSVSVEWFVTGEERNELKRSA